MESLEDLLIRTINEGAPLYNAGKIKACYDLYLDAGKYACMQEKLTKSVVGQLLEQATDEAMQIVEESQDYNEAAWVLRTAFDEVLHRWSRSGSRSALLLKHVDSEESRGGYWQDELVENTTDLEKAQSLADTYTILLASISPAAHTRFTTHYAHCFPGSIVVETLLMLGLAEHRKMAAEKAKQLHQGKLLVSVSHSDETKFHDGTRLYRFATQQEVESALNAMEARGQHYEGSFEAIQTYMLRAVLEVPMMESDKSTVFSGISSEHLRPRTVPTSEKGIELAELAQKVEQAVECSDRKYHFATYKSCFVGSEAVSALVERKDFPVSTRQEALELLESLLTNSLIHHVTRDHRVEDKYLFYRFTSPRELQTALDAHKRIAHPTNNIASIKYTAIIERLKQSAGLTVTEILNSFFGCNDPNGGEPCWDIVDLQVWRNNMKRWGFGRPEDQDNDMVDKLSLLVQNIDPNDWKMEDQDDEWSSPWGILAQIAIFDQVPRSAFRGSSDAFKWDQLAIRATKVAIERGYFDTAYKSTLNQFLVLLPLEHSETWEDQKLGVTLLLQLLSRVAVEDEGLSDYEIVKRLEFSKRLSTAFLEHAQVIAKFHRYPHRNQAHGRTTTLEERIWLASDLVPRWAKSQQPSSAADAAASRNLIRLPVIPLKRLTRG